MFQSELKNQKYKITISFFIKFLKKNKAYDNFMANVHSESAWDTRRIYFRGMNFNEVLIYAIKNNEMGYFITYAFPWRETNENYDYWKGLSNKWNKICEILML